jgi:hypothetical protein
LRSALGEAAKYRVKNWPCKEVSKRAVARRRG